MIDTGQSSATESPVLSDERVLSAATAMNAVTLRVSDLEKLSGYYANAFAMEPLEERTRGAELHRVLGRGDTPMVRLISTPGLPVADPRQAGLFHTAFLFDDRASLAATVYRAAQDPLSRFAGSSDHSVSEAFYFVDPEGNGVELYVDRDRSAWVRERGQIMMNTVYLDPNAFLRDTLTEAALEAGPAAAGRVGHVHLQVGDLVAARDFYIGALGFEVTLREYPGALFASAGGYHHHIAMNVWNSRGAGPRAASLGLGNVAVTVPAREDLDMLAARLRSRRLQFADTGRAITLNDPWGTQVTLSVAGATAEEALNA